MRAFVGALSLDYVAMKYKYTRDHFQNTLSLSVRPYDFHAYGCYLLLGF